MTAPLFSRQAGAYALILVADDKLDTRNNRDFGGAMIHFVVDGFGGAICVGLMPRCS